jgi:hypothetical protein
MGVSEALHIREGHGLCEVHDWPWERWVSDFVPLLRERHGRGGVNVCRECIDRAKAAADRARGL